MKPSHEKMSPLLRWTVYRPVTVFVVFVAILVVGVMAFPRIPLQLMPSGLSQGVVGIRIQVPGGTPRENMEAIVKPAEELLRTIPGVQKLYSNTQSDRCYLSVRFDPSLDHGVFTAEVRDRLDRAKLKWPEGVDRYRIWRSGVEEDIPMFIAGIGVQYDRDQTDLTTVFDEVIGNHLRAIDGVARVRFWGLVEKRVTIDLDKNKVHAHDVNVRELVERLSRDNLNVTGGKTQEGDRDLLVRSVGKFESFEEIENYPVRPGLTVGDIAEVGYYRSLRNYWSRVNGEPSRFMLVYKDSLANARDVCRRIEETIERLKKELPRQNANIHSMEVFTFLNQGEIIELSIRSLGRSGAWGGVFAVIVLLIFFRKLRLTFLVTLSIPFSLLIAITWIYFADGTFNILSLMGLSLGIGMLVDNSIVVVENILRKREQGDDAVDAAVEGLRDIGLAIALATLTTVAVFLPLMFLANQSTRVMHTEIGVPVCVSVLASLIVALVFVPQGAILLLRAKKRRKAPRRWRVLRVVWHRWTNRPRRYFDFFERVMLSLGARLNFWTQRVLGLCLAHRFEAFMVFGAILATSFWAWKKVPVTSDMESGQARIEYQVTLPKNRTFREANELFEQVEQVFDQRREELKIETITSWFNVQEGEFRLYFEPGVRIKAEDFFNEHKAILPKIPGVTIRISGDMFTAEDWGERLRVFVRGADLDTMYKIGEKVESELSNKGLFPELEDFRIQEDSARDEVRVTAAREIAQHYGINSQSIGRMVSWALRGAVLPDYQTEDRELPLWIRYDDADKEGIEELDSVPVYRPDGEPVRLENLAKLSVGSGPESIRRLNGKMTLGFVADIKSKDAHYVKQRVRRHLARMDIPEGFEVLLRLPGREAVDDVKEGTMALVLAMLLVFFIMGLLFESFVLPFSVVLSLPHAFFGSLWALYLFGVSLDPVGIVGLVMLVGIVVNNAIVLVDTINRRRSLGGLSRTDAILAAAKLRFRPIWMTAMTTVFGLLPLAAFRQIGEGIDYKSMSIVLIGGLTTSTFFTLFVVPLFYTILDDLRRVVWTLVFGVKPSDKPASPETSV